MFFFLFTDIEIVFLRKKFSENNVQAQLLCCQLYIETRKSFVCYFFISVSVSFLPFFISFLSLFSFFFFLLIFLFFRLQSTYLSHGKRKEMPFCLQRRKFNVGRSQIRVPSRRFKIGHGNGIFNGRTCNEAEWIEDVKRRQQQRRRR